MRGSSLQGALVAHHGFDAIRCIGPGELLGLALAATDNRDSGFVDGTVGVDLKHAPGLFFRLFVGGVGGVSLLPQKFHGTQEGTGT